MTTPLFEIALPIKDNSGAPLRRAHDAFRKAVLKTAGGFTEMPSALGCWRDPASGDIYLEQMRAYRIACEREVFDELTGLVFTLFPDQIAIFTAQIGTANIVSRAPVLDGEAALPETVTH